MTGCDPDDRRLARWAPLGLLAVTFLAYLPAILHGGFIWDDDAYVTGNDLLRSGEGLRDIWTRIGFKQGGTHQYYPLTFTALWVEYHLWGLQPMGYHAVNVLLHSVGAILFWRILAGLCAPGALLAAAIFAVHPAHAESVAWVTEIKNTLSGVFYLLSMGSSLRFLGLLPPASRGPRERQGQYLLALFFCLCALSSKTVTASLPAAVLLIAWWKTGRLDSRSLALAAPMLLLGFGAGRLTSFLEKYDVGALGRDWDLTPLQRCLVAGRILWFYAGKLVWPAPLTFIYPRWDIDPGAWRQYSFPLAAAAVPAILWRIRGRAGRGPLAAALFFAGTLLPVSGFFSVYPMRFSFVADHFQYLASLGLIALLAAALTLAAQKAAARAALPAAGALILALGSLTWVRCGIYGSSERVWNDTLEKNPSCWFAHFHLGVALADQGKTDEAIGHYRDTLRLNPDFVIAHNGWGLALMQRGRVEEALGHYREALRVDPGLWEAHYNLGLALVQQGDLEQALLHFRRTAEIYPRFAELHNNWGVALARQGALDDAIGHFREALRLRPGYGSASRNLELAEARRRG